MCGRTSLANLPDHLRPFLLRLGVRDVPPGYTPRYNVAPSQDQLVIVERGGSREACAMRWGLIPRWAQDPSIGNKLANARCETAATKPSYREAFAKRRGLIVADSYYEWRKNPKGPKTPFRVHRTDGEPFVIGALWERWGIGENAIESCTVLTTAATEAMALIHDRMPVIIAGSHADDWLCADTPPARIQRIIAHEGDSLASYPVSCYVNVPSHDDAMCWAPDETLPIDAIRHE